MNANQPDGPMMKMRHRGFSLTELIVGMAIAMIIFLVISMVFSSFENQKRVTTLSSDAQTSGMMALVDMEQAIRSAAAGILADDLLNCPAAGTTQPATFSYYYKASAPASTTSPVPGYSQFFAPVVITDGGAGSDSIDIRIGGPVSGSLPNRLIEKIDNTSTQIRVQVNSGYPLGKVLLIVGPPDPYVAQTNCMVVEVTGTVDTGEIPATDGVGRNVMLITPKSSGDTWNPSSAYKVTNNWPTFAEDKSYVYNPGMMTYRTYSVVNNRLRVTNQRADAVAGVEDVAADVVSLQAQYGIASAVGNQDVANWVEPTGAWAAAALTADSIRRIKAIRFVIVTRAPKLEATAVTSTCINNGGPAANPNKGPCAWEDTAADPAPRIDLSADPDWQRYRYRAFQTIVPVRNLIWAGL